MESLEVHVLSWESLSWKHWTTLVDSVGSTAEVFEPTQLLAEAELIQCLYWISRVEIESQLRLTCSFLNCRSRQRVGVVNVCRVRLVRSSIPNKTRNIPQFYVGTRDGRSRIIVGEQVYWFYHRSVTVDREHPRFREFNS